MEKPLDGVRIVDMSTHGACPSCGKILADWGAEVIKVEAKSGDAARTSGQSFGVPSDEGMNPHFDMLNAGKKSIVVDMKTPEGRDIIDQLLTSANALITNFRTPALVKLKLDYESVSEKFPHLIWGHLTGFGEKGPAANHAGFDTVAYYARSGAMIDFSENGAAPINAPFGVGDLSAGSAFAGGIAAALYQQQKTGKGQRVSISLYGQSIWAHGVVMQSIYHGAEYPRTRENATVPLNNCFRCKDGEWLYMSVLQYERYFAPFCKLIGREDLIDDPRYNTIEQAKLHNRELIALFDKSFAQHTRAEWNLMLESADIAHDNINHFKDALSDPQALENGFIRPIYYNDGRDSVIASPPVILGEADTAEPKAGPRLGENTAEVLRSLHFSEGTIQDYYKREIVK